MAGKFQYGEVLTRDGPHPPSVAKLSSEQMAHEQSIRAIIALVACITNLVLLEVSCMDDLDTQVRLKAFQFLEEQLRIYREILPSKLLETGFNFEGQKIPLISPQGIL